MVEELDRSRGDNVGKASWLKIFTGFRLALDPKKLLLAAAGIFVVYLGWWAISVVFCSLRSVPEADDYERITAPAEKKAYLSRAVSWSMLQILAGSPVKSEIIDGWRAVRNRDTAHTAQIDQLVAAMDQKWGVLHACPWNENRGPNQVMVVSRFIETGNTGLNSGDVMNYLRFVVEPLDKFLLPVVYFFDGRVGGMLSLTRIYLIFVLLWMIVVWGIFGGAITRIACVQLARNEKVSVRESLQFVFSRWQGYVFAPILPMVALLVLSIMLWIFGLFFGVTFFLGDIVGGILWPITMVLGLIMAVILVGLLGWPLMNATISTEGSDSFDALSRSYSYVYQVPWHCLWYLTVSVVYGAALIFFVGFMGTLLVYLGKWGVAQAHFFDARDPAFLCMYAPESFNWRDVLLQDSTNAEINKKTGHYMIPPEKLPADWYQHTSLGTYLVTFWLGLFFLLIIGFGYSYFWTAATIIYLLLRQKVDDTDLDEVYLEEEEDKAFMSESPVPPPATAPSPAATAPVASSPNNSPPAVKFTMVDLNPSIRPAEPPPVPPPDSSPAPATSPEHGASPPS